MDCGVRSWLFDLGISGLRESSEYYKYDAA